MVINLLPQPTAEEIKFLKKKKFLELLSIICLVAAIVFVLAIFGFLAILGSETAVVNKKIAETEAKVNQLTDRESLLRGFKIKIEFLTRVLEDRPKFHAILVDLYALLPTGVAFSDVTLDKGELTVAGMTASRFELAELISRFTDIRTLGEKEIEKATLTSVVKEKTGLYRFSVKIALKS